MRLRKVQFYCVSACVLSLLLGVDAWSCNVTLIGDTEQQQSVAFSTAAIHCTPGVDERGQDLLVVVDSTLSSIEYTGKYAVAVIIRMRWCHDASLKKVLYRKEVCRRRFADRCRCFAVACVVQG